jgi:hypothetical protein
MIVALARKLLIALWRMVTTGEVPTGVRLRPVEARRARTMASKYTVSAPGRTGAVDRQRF